MSRESPQELVYLSQCFDRSLSISVLLERSRFFEQNAPASFISTSQGESLVQQSQCFGEVPIITPQGRLEIEHE
jgi:hypothetical protein